MVTLTGHITIFFRIEYQENSQKIDNTSALSDLQWSLKYLLLSECILNKRLKYPEYSYNTLATCELFMCFEIILIFVVE